MPTLDDKIFNKIDSFNTKADQFINDELYPEAIKEYQKAWNALPEPKQLWDAALWIKVGQAECLLTLADFQQGKQKLHEAILCAGAVNNPLVHLLLGICCFELNETKCAKDELQMAWDLQGESIFQDGDEKYKQFLLDLAD